MHVLDDPTRHDSSAVTEIISLGLERVASICQRRGVSMPTKAIMFGDNTVRELKNQFCMDYMAHMVAKRKMRLFASYFLRKSHTHDKIDQLWGVVARRIANCDSTLRAERHPQDCPAGAKSPWCSCLVGKHYRASCAKA